MQFHNFFQVWWTEYLREQEDTQQMKEKRVPQGEE